MIGDHYFQQRAQLGRILQDLRAEVELHGRDTESLLILDNLISSLTEPFVFVVVGEVNVGKSTFLNALFGQTFSKTGVVPTTDKILFFKHGETEERVSVTPTLDEMRVPSDLLKDFHIVDTPGTNSIQDEHQQITERFVPVADLVIFVFSATNPWGASAWKFLEKVHRDWMRNVIFVLQQSDLRTGEEIQVITDYMGQLTRQRFGREFPIFPVSAKHAYLARSSGIDREGLLKESGFDALEQYISSSITGSESRIHKLHTTCQLAIQRLDYLKSALEQSQQRATAKRGLLDELVSERELQLDRTLKKVTPAVDATERDYHDSVIRVAGLAEQTLSTRRAFKRGDGDQEERDPPPSLDHRLLQDLQKHNSDRWRQVAMILDEDVAQYERFIRTQGRDALFDSAEESERATGEEARGELRRHFTARVDRAIRRFVVGLHLDELIEPGFNKAVKRARWVPWLIVPAVLATILGSYFGGWQAGAAAGGCGLLLVGAFVLLTKATLSSTRRQLIDKLDASSNQLHEFLSKQVREDVESAFHRFESMLLPARDETGKRVDTLTSQIGELSDLETRLRQLEENLRPGASPA